MNADVSDFDTESMARRWNQLLNLGHISNAHDATMDYVSFRSAGGLTKQYDLDRLTYKDGGDMKKGVNEMLDRVQYRQVKGKSSREAKAFDATVNGLRGESRSAAALGQEVQRGAAMVRERGGAGLGIAVSSEPPNSAPTATSWAINPDYASGGDVGWLCTCGSKTRHQPGCNTRAKIDSLTAEYGKKEGRKMWKLIKKRQERQQRRQGGSKIAAASAMLALASSAMGKKGGGDDDDDDDDDDGDDDNDNDGDDDDDDDDDIGGDGDGGAGGSGGASGPSKKEHKQQALADVVAASPSFGKAPAPGWWCWQWHEALPFNDNQEEQFTSNRGGGNAAMEHTIAPGASKERRDLQAYRLGASRVVATKLQQECGAEHRRIIGEDRALLETGRYSTLVYSAVSTREYASLGTGIFTVDERLKRRSSRASMKLQKA